MGSVPVGIQCPLTWRVSRLLGLDLVSWVFARVGVHRLSLLPCLGVFPFTLHLQLDFIRVSSLQLMYLHPDMAPDVVVPETKHGCAWSRNLDPNFCSGRDRISDLGIQRPRTLPLDYCAPPPFSRLLRNAGYNGTIL